MDAPIKGRGAQSNRRSRFLRHSADASPEFVDADPDEEEAPARHPATTLHVDSARTIISRNDSPDVPFGQSINPYRGCEHGCIYCMAGDTPVLLADGMTRPIAELRAGDEIYGTVRSGRHRRYVRTTVLAHWSVIKPAHRITLADGTELVAGGDHRFLTERGWKFVTGAAPGRARRPHLTTGHKLIGTGQFARSAPADADYRRGYLCGLIRGDGTRGEYGDTRGRGQGPRRDFRLALVDAGALERAERWLREDRIATRRLEFRTAAAGGGALQAIRTQAREPVARVRELTVWPERPSASWQRGFLAGIFDAEGSYRRGILRMTSTDPATVGRVTTALEGHGFRFVVERFARGRARRLEVVRVLGGLAEHLRFFHTTDPASPRKRDISGQRLKSPARLEVTAIEPLSGAQRLYDITTGTGDFIANGVVSHNCYARPTHAYLDHSPGLDFETQIYFKPDAAMLLDRELRRRGYRPEPIHLGANTDPYQPLEREVKITRQILAKLLEFGHPVTVLTKGALIERDVDLLAELARRRLARVAFSITTLDRELKRTLEPRAASPAARLRALATLASAGVPTAVMVAPVIPAVNDHELEAILEAAAKAGAQRAGWILLRLPREVRELMAEWLAAHRPLAAARVLGLLKDARGGRDTDGGFGARMRGEGAYAALIGRRFVAAARRFGLATGPMPDLDTAQFRAPDASGQLGLF